MRVLCSSLPNGLQMLLQVVRSAVVVCIVLLTIRPAMVHNNPNPIYKRCSAKNLYYVCKLLTSSTPPGCKNDKAAVTIGRHHCAATDPLRCNRPKNVVQMRCLESTAMNTGTLSGSCCTEQTKVHFACAVHVVPL